ncbi:MAG TPA: hypothetical protein VNW52_00630 [Burkholderiaceae bacterium]|nr:hypothetical protein [Burkholderiaceae bacterium]
MMPTYVKKLLTLWAFGLLFTTTPTAAFAIDCAQNWEHPIAQQIEMRGMSLSLEEYANNERHFSIRQANHVLDIYFLQDALLIKGPPVTEIEHYSEEELSWFPMAFAIPNGILSSMSPKGPCSVKSKTQFSQPLSGILGFGSHKLTFVEGSVTPKGPSALTYSFAATVNPPLEGLGSIQYTGSMRFAHKIKPLAASTNVTGYTLIGVAHPLPVVGDGTLRLSTVGELRALLARLEPQEKDTEESSGEILKQ